MAALQGKSWFRANIAPYLSIIKSAMSGYPPIITLVDTTTVTTNVTVTVTVTGDFFTPDMTVTCPTGTTSNFVFINQHEVKFDFITTTAQSNTISFATPFGAASFTIVSTVVTWIDLRLGSGSTFTEVHRSGTTVTRDANGMRTSGSVWSSWVRFPSHEWNRSVMKKLSMIVQGNSSAHMVGIMSAANQNTTSTAQYYEAEIYAYCPSSYIWGFYGTNAAGGGTSNSQSNIQISSYPYYKIEFNDNGQVGSTFKVFGLSNLSNFDDQTNLLGTWTVGTNMSANDTLIMPCFTMSSGSRLVAYLVENM